MLSGDNSLLTKATEAKRRTGNAQDEETISLAYLSAITGKYADNSDISTTTLTNELEKTYGSGNITVTKDDSNNTYTVAIKGKGTYTIDANGKVEKAGPVVAYTNERIVESSAGTGTTVEAGTKTPNIDKLYIYFEASVENGTTSISPSVPFEISENGTYNFTITSTVNGDTYTSKHSVTANQYAVRAGINVGDYVTYIPPKNPDETVKSYELTAGTSGNTTDQNLTQQYNSWRILHKYTDGTLDLVPSFTDGVTYTKIKFRDAKGWNNAPYLLDDMCEVLYEAPNTDSKKAITARSIDYEDITKYMIEGEEGENSSNSTGLKKILKYQSEQVGNLSTGTYIDSIDESNNIVTYKGRTSYPTLYPIVKNDESNPYFTVETLDSNSSSNGRVEEKPENLQLKYTYFDKEIKVEDCLDEISYQLLFGAYKASTWREYWIASRCVLCDPDRAMFGIRYVSNSWLKGEYSLYYSTEMCSDYSKSLPICPIVTIGSDVEVIKSSNQQQHSDSNRHTIVIPN